MICPVCALEIPAEDSFCESCGGRVADAAGSEPTTACKCGSTEGLDREGFCLGCGRRVLRPASDHVELALEPGMAAVSDRGRVHDRNEDRFALERLGETGILVVCDGVSSTRDAEHASEITAEVLAGALRRALEADSGVELEPVFVEAFREAALALERPAGSPGRRAEAPSTTAVAAVVRGQELAVAWMGDSRAYWITATEARQLTADHSWMREVLEAGEMEPAEALRSPHAHAITRWLGGDAPAESGPEIVNLALTEAGTLLLCSDGLWNYLELPEQMFAAVQESRSGASTDVEIARSLVALANECGGQDNITVALLSVAVQDAAAQAEQD